MAQAHLKAGLAGVDGGHTGPELGAMHFPHSRHPIQPGMDHFVAEGAEGGLPGQGFQQGPRQHDFAEIAPIRIAPASVQPRRAAHAAITPAHLNHGEAPWRQGAFEMLPVQAVKQGQQGLQGHGAGKPADRRIVAAFADKPQFANAVSQTPKLTEQQQPQWIGV